MKSNGKHSVSKYLLIWNKCLLLKVFEKVIFNLIELTNKVILQFYTVLQMIDRRSLILLPATDIYTSG